MAWPGHGACCPAKAQMPGGSSHLFSVSRDSHPIQLIIQVRPARRSNGLACAQARPSEEALAVSQGHRPHTAGAPRRAPAPLTPTRTRRARGHSKYSHSKYSHSTAIVSMAVVGIAIVSILIVSIRSTPQCPWMRRSVDSPIYLSTYLPIHMHSIRTGAMSGVWGCASNQAVG